MIDCKYTASENVFFPQIADQIRLTGLFCLVDVHARVPLVHLLCRRESIQLLLSSKVFLGRLSSASSFCTRNQLNLLGFPCSVDTIGISSSSLCHQIVILSEWWNVFDRTLAYNRWWTDRCSDMDIHCIALGQCVQKRRHSSLVAYTSVLCLGWGLHPWRWTETWRGGPNLKFVSVGWHSDVNWKKHSNLWCHQLLGHLLSLDLQQYFFQF